MTTKFAEEARALASPYAKKALKRAAELAGLVKDVKAAEAESVQAQCIAIILDRAYGRPKQPVEGDMLHGMSEELRKYIAGNNAPGRSFLGFDEEDSDDVVSEPASRH